MIKGGAFEISLLLLLKLINIIIFTVYYYLLTRYSKVYFQTFLD
jgi:hypothetical protein